MTITGTGGGGSGNWNMGAYIAGSTIEATGGGHVNLTGSASSTSTGLGSYGIQIIDSANESLVSASGAGNVTLTGTGGSAGTGSVGTDGVNLNSYQGKPISIYTESGTLTINGTRGNTSTDSFGIDMQTGGSLVGSAVTLGSATQTGAIILNGNEFKFTDTNAQANAINSINTSGTVTFAPISDSFSAAQTLPYSNVVIDSRIGGLTIGKEGNTANVTFASAQNVAGPISAYGGDITVNGNINTSAGNANGDILLKASGNIVQSASKTITTNNGDVILWANSDGATANGSVLLKRINNYHQWGHVWMGGGSGSTTWNGLAVGNGQAVSGTTFVTPVSGTSVYESGIYLEKASIQSGGGNVYLAGSSAGTEAGFDFGVLTYDVCSINSGSGTITIIGVRNPLQ